MKKPPAGIRASGKTKRGADSEYRMRPTPGRSSDPPWRPSIALKGTRRTPRKSRYRPVRFMGNLTVGTERDLVTGDPTNPVKIACRCVSRPLGPSPHPIPTRRSSSSAADKKVSPAPRTNQRTTRSRPPTTVQLEKPKHRYHCRLPVPHTMMQYARVPCVLDQNPMPKGVNTPMVVEMKPHSIVPLSQSRPISEEAPHRYTKKYEGDACDEIFLEAVAKISEGDDHLGDRRIDGSTGSNRSNQKSTKESLLQFLTSAGFGP